jgi:hypothetical protein
VREEVLHKCNDLDTTHFKNERQIDLLQLFLKRKTFLYTPSTPVLNIRENLPIRLIENIMYLDHIMNQIH